MTLLICIVRWLLVSQHFLQLIRCDIPIERDPNPGKRLPLMDDPLIENDDCLIKGGNIVTSKGYPEHPSCRLAPWPLGMTECCYCTYQKHFRFLLDYMITLWKLYSVEGRPGRIANLQLITPDPTEFGDPETYVPPLEADNAHFTVFQYVVFKCYVTIPPAVYKKFEIVEHVFRTRHARQKRLKRATALSTKWLHIMCGQNRTYKRDLAPSQRQYFLDSSGEVQLLGLTGVILPPPYEVLNGFCIDSKRRARGPAQDANRPKNPRRITDRNVPFIRSASVEIPASSGAVTCLEVAAPRLSTPAIAVDPEVQATAAIVLDLIKGKASQEDLYKLPPNDEDSDADYEEHSNLQQTIAASYENEGPDTSLRLISTSYESLYPGLYVSRNLDRAGPSNHLGFNIPRAAIVPSLRHLPAEDEAIVDLQLSLMVCASRSVSSPHSALLSTDYQQVAKP